MELAYSSIEGKSRRYTIALWVLVALAAVGFASFIISYIGGHQFFGGNNAVPWGLPIVLAIYFIGLSAGSLILSSLTYVFGREQYRPIARAAVFLAIVLIMGAMIFIALDLGRPEKFWRLFMFFYLNNMTSMFAINGIFYGGYFAISAVYLGVIFSGNKKVTRILGIVAVCWAVLVHMGTGAIFGFVAAREVFYSPVKPLEFLAAAMVSGLGLLIVAIFLSLKLSGRTVKNEMFISLGRLLLALAGVLLLLVFIDKLTHLYPPERDAVLYVLGGPYAGFFWAQVVLGYLVPIGILAFPRTGKSLNGVIIASVSAVVGIFFERYALVIPGAAYPLHLYPGQVEGVWGAVGGFPIMPVEVLLAIGMIALLGIVYLNGMRLFDLLPVKEPESEAKPVEVKPAEPKPEAKS